MLYTEAGEKIDADARVWEHVAPTIRVIWYSDIEGFAIGVISSLMPLQACGNSAGSLNMPKIGLGCRSILRTSSRIKKYQFKQIGALQPLRMIEAPLAAHGLCF